MKTYYKFLWTALFSLFLLGACSSGGEDLPEPEPTPKPDPDKVTISTTDFTAEAKEGTLTLCFTTNKAWTASSDQTWCKPDKTSGSSGNVTITLTLEANSTDQERTAKITVKAGTATATATVKQAKKEADNGEQGGQQGGEQGGQQGGEQGGEETSNSNTVEDMQNKKW